MTEKEKSESEPLKESLKVRVIMRQKKKSFRGRRKREDQRVNQGKDSLKERVSLRLKRRVSEGDGKGKIRE